MRGIEQRLDKSNDERTVVVGSIAVLMMENGDSSGYYLYDSEHFDGHTSRQLADRLTDLVGKEGLEGVAKMHLISLDSPVGQAIQGHVEGENLKYTLPRGSASVTINKIFLPGEFEFQLDWLEQ
jgi:hypothetical protein